MRREDCPSDYRIAMHLVGEGPEEIAAHLAGCTRCASRVAEHRAVGDRYLGSEAAAALRARLEERPRPAPWWLRRPLAIGAGVLAPTLAMAVVLLAVRPQGPGTDLAPKGSIPGSLHAFAGDGAGPIPDGGTIVVGQPLQLAWSGARAGYLVVLGQDSTGGLEVLFPEGDGAQAVPVGRDQPLGPSLSFDAPEPRYRFIALFSTAPFTTEDARARLADGPTPDDAVSEFTLRVVAP